MRGILGKSAACKQRHRCGQWSAQWLGAAEGFEDGSALVRERVGDQGNEFLRRRIKRDQPVQMRARCSRNRVLAIRGRNCQVGQHR